MKQVGRVVPLGNVSPDASKFLARSPSGDHLALATYDEIRLIDLRSRRLLGVLSGRFGGTPAWPAADRLIETDFSGASEHVVVIDPDRQTIIARREIPHHTTLQQSATPRELVVMTDTGLGSPLSVVVHRADGVGARIGLGLIRSGVENARTATGMPPLAQAAIDASGRDLAGRTGSTGAAIRTLVVRPGYWAFPCCSPEQTPSQEPSACGERQEQPRFSIGIWVPGYAIVLTANGRDYRYHTLLKTTPSRPVLCASYPSAEAPPLPVNNLVDARPGTSHGRFLLVAAPHRRVFVVSGDGRIARVELATRKLSYVLLRRPFPASAGLDEAGWLGAGRLAMRLYERPEKPDAAIWTVDLRKRTARLVTRDPHGCTDLTTGAGLILVHVQAELPLFHPSCGGLTAFGAGGRLRFRLLRDERVSRIQISGSRAYVTLGGDPQRGIEPNRLAIVDLTREKVLKQIPMNRRIELLLPD